MRRLAGSIVGIVLVLSPLIAVAGQVKPDEGDQGAPLVYQQITDFAEGTGGIGQPALSGDGATAAYAMAPADGVAPNRIFTIGFDGTGMTEVDSYVPNCFCGSWVDISADGSTVISSDSMQVRLVSNGGTARVLVNLGSNELSSIRVTAAGDKVFFMIGRDTSQVDSQEVMTRGIYMVEASGGEPELIVGPDDLAALVDLTPDQIGLNRLATQVLDISNDGSRIVFGAYVGPQQAAFTADGDGGDLRQVGELAELVQRVAMAGDGSLAAIETLPDDPQSDAPEISLVAPGGGEPEVLLTGIPTNSNEPIQLSGDGSRLLISPQSYLVDTADGAIRQLAALTPGADSHTELLADVMERATMNDDANRFLYAMRTSRCADCPNMQEQLATLDTELAEPGDAVVISNATIDPAEIALDAANAATASAGIATSGELIAVGVVALRDGTYDVNVARDARLVDDGTIGDPTAGDGTYVNAQLVHIGAAAREDDTGPRTIRFQAEVETGDGLRHAIAYDVATLTVVAGE